MEATPSVSRLKSYIEALRPKTLTASFIPVVVGTLLAPKFIFDINYTLCFSLLFTAFFIQIGTNLVNDAIDYLKGADTSQRLGPKRIILTSFASPKTVLWAGGVSFLLACLTAIPFLLVGGLPFAFILALSIFLGWAYTAGPFPLAYKGLGELFILIFFGLVLTGSANYFQTGVFSFDSLVAGLQIGLLSCSFYAIGNLRDAPQDQKAGKNTLAVRFGETFAKWEVASVVILPFLLNFYWIEKGPLAFFLPLFTFPMAYDLIRGIFRTRPSKFYNRFFQDAALLHFCFGILLGTGFHLS